MNRTRFVTQAGVTAAVYAGASLLALGGLGTFASGPIQFRVSEALTVLAALTPAAIPGLWIGTCIANQFAGLGVLDVVFGGFATLAGAWWTWRFRAHTALALLGPVLFNALVVPAYLPLVLDDPFGPVMLPVTGLSPGLAAYLFGVMTVGIGQAVVVYMVGWPLLEALRRVGFDTAFTR